MGNWPISVCEHGDPLFIFNFWSVITILNKWKKMKQMFCWVLFRGNDLKRFSKRPTVAL